MKTIKKVDIIPVFVEFIPDIKKENHIYISEKYSVAVHHCLCGCLQRTVMPISDTDNNKWKLIKEKDGTVSFIGSVGNYNFPCKSHYVITKNVANFI